MDVLSSSANYHHSLLFANMVSGAGGGVRGEGGRGDSQARKQRTTHTHRQTVHCKISFSWSDKLNFAFGSFNMYNQLFWDYLYSVSSNCIFGLYHVEICSQIPFPVYDWRSLCRRLMCVSSKYRYIYSTCTCARLCTEVQSDTFLVHRHPGQERTIVSLFNTI